MSLAESSAVPAAGTAEDVVDSGGARAGGGPDGANATITFAALAAGLGAQVPTDPALAGVTFALRRLRAGETLHRAGDAFHALHFVRSGFLKSVAVDGAGSELVLGFPMGGDVIGLDGVETGRHGTDVIALDMSSVAVLPFAQLTQLARRFPCVERLLYSLFSREVAGKHSLAWLLGAFSADARLASFLLDLAERFGRLGYSRSTFLLRMTRQELGSYLGMKLETVSRMFSAFAASGLVRVDGKSITLTDVEGLQRTVGQRAHGRSRVRRGDSAVAIAPRLAIVARRAGASLCVA